MFAPTQATTATPSNLTNCTRGVISGRKISELLLFPHFDKIQPKPSCIQKSFLNRYLDFRISEK